LAAGKSPPHWSLFHPPPNIQEPGFVPNINIVHKYIVRTATLVQKKKDTKNTNKEHTRFDHNSRSLANYAYISDYKVAAVPFYYASLWFTDYNLCLNITVRFTRLPHNRPTALPSRNPTHKWANLSVNHDPYPTLSLSLSHTHTHTHIRYYNTQMCPFDEHILLRLKQHAVGTNISQWLPW
jgi:hypothetical protein